MQISRFRVKGRGTDVAAQIERAVDAEGGDAVLNRIHQHVTDYLERRRGVLHLDVSGDVDQSYGALLEALSGS